MNLFWQHKCKDDTRDKLALSSIKNHSYQQTTAAPGGGPGDLDAEIQAFSPW